MSEGSGKPRPSGRGAVTEREQKLVDLIFEIGIKAAGWQCHRDVIEKEQLAEWIADVLRQSGFDTTPMGMSWGVLK